MSRWTSANLQSVWGHRQATTSKSYKKFMSVYWGALFRRVLWKLQLENKLFGV
jgi:hypothetical protein